MVRLSNKTNSYLSKNYFPNWEISASLCGPTTRSGKTLDDKTVLPSPIEKGSIVLKYQKCGKERCKKCQDGKGHGPYKWKVTYIGMVYGKKKYRWKYLGPGKTK